LGHSEKEETIDSEPYLLPALTLLWLDCAVRCHCVQKSRYARLLEILHDLLPTLVVNHPRHERFRKIGILLAYLCAEQDSTGIEQRVFGVFVTPLLENFEVGGDSWVLRLKGKESPAVGESIFF
jgi:hypothetical protein